MKKRNIAQIVIVALIFVLALAGVIYGVVTHEEAGFMHEGKRWESMPLRISCAGYVPARADDCEVVESIAGTINTRLRFNAFEYVGEGEAEIDVTIGVPHDPGFMDTSGDATLSYEGDRFTRCEVRTSNTGTIEMLALVVHHELGHCLDLAHDPDSDVNIMRPEQRPTPDRTIPPWISDHDKGLLRDLYAD